MEQTRPSASYKDLLTLSLPLILSMSGVMLMQFVDAIFLSWYSPDAIAAIGPAGMASFFLTSAFSGTAGFKRPRMPLGRYPGYGPNCYRDLQWC